MLKGDNSAVFQAYADKFKSNENFENLDLSIVSNKLTAIPIQKRGNHQRNLHENANRLSLSMDEYDKNFKNLPYPMRLSQNK